MEINCYCFILSLYTFHKGISKPVSSDQDPHRVVIRCMWGNSCMSITGQCLVPGNTCTSSELKDTLSFSTQGKNIKNVRIWRWELLSDYCHIDQGGYNLAYKGIGTQEWDLKVKAETSEVEQHQWRVADWVRNTRGQVFVKC